MPDTNPPVQGTPSLAYQPWDATEEGTADTAPGPTMVYEGNQGQDPTGWVKIKDGGAADMNTGKASGVWPGDGASDGSAWKQC